MIDAANATNIATVGRLRAAGLLDLAERVARREELQLHHVIAIGGDPTGGHVALWRALAAEGKDAAALSTILGWPAAVIEANLARPKPKLVERIPAPPKSGPRAVRPAPVDVAAVIEAAVAAAVAPLHGEIATLRKQVDLLQQRFDARETDDAHLSRLGAVGDVIRDVASRRGVSLQALLAGRRTDAVTSAKTEIVRILTADDRFRMSQPEIAAALRMDRSSVVYLQVRAGVPANGRRPKAAA